MSKAGYDFASSSNHEKKVSNTINNKERDLTETQKKLKKHGYGVDNNKAGVGFTPNAPVKISSKAKNASTQHISVSIEQDHDEPKSTHWTSVFDRMNRSRSRMSALNRIGGQNRTSVFKRLNMPASQSSVFLKGCQNLRGKATRLALFLVSQLWKDLKTTRSFPEIGRQCQRKENST
ncbi:hypothetical protein PS1_008023 [Malus domestica]